MQNYELSLNLDSRMQAFVQLGKDLSVSWPELDAAVLASEAANPWFTESMVRQALHGWSELLTLKNLCTWMVPYPILEKPLRAKMPRVAVVGAGNIPLVCFHDILCVLICGFRLAFKPSSKDVVLPQVLLERLAKIEPAFADYFEIYLRPIEGFNAVITAGSSASKLHYQRHLMHYPHIIRGHRRSCAVLDGKETLEDCCGLMDDMFLYYGMGCRNVSMLIVPTNYDLAKLVEIWKTHSGERLEMLMSHPVYRNNYDLQKARLLTENLDFIDVGGVLLTEDPAIDAPLSVVHYRYYSRFEEVPNYFQEYRKLLQVVVSNAPFATADATFGHAQKPRLNDYSDRENTIEFLVDLLPK